ncbi:hypothetical protein [Planomicrobium okeanokoites]|uniref:hypothetical protein n=1 Tax=Planomicrobium okeanokoites TaxID=244 RepID=UPI0024935546|nr:hypothetical protein [Planomicrobium okeanokoites]
MSPYLIEEQGWSYNELWQGCILVSIAHAIFVADAPELAHEISWDDFNYNINNSQGSRGTITFHPNFFVAGFRNDELSSEGLSAKDCLGQAPEKVIQLAEQETLQYLLDDVNGKTLPSITTAMWGDKNQVFSCHSFDEMLVRGGELLEIQSMDPAAAFEACEEAYEFTEEQLTLLKKLFYLKIAQPNEAITLSQSDIDAIGSRNEEGINESKISFAETGIGWI